MNDEFTAMITALLVALAAVAAWLSKRFLGGATPIIPGARPPADTGSASSIYSSGIVALANAIAAAEGFGIPGAIPTRANNPGNLVIPGWKGETLGAEGISVFATADEGWKRLYNQLQLIKDGRSRVYTLNDTIATMGAKWAPHDGGNWAANVSRVLQMPLTTRLGDLL